MSRVKGAINALKRRRKILKLAKGFRFARSRKESAAREALHHAGNHAFNHRRDKKGDFRRLWNVRINAAVRAEGLTYSRFISALKSKEIGLNRKMLADLATNHPEAFSSVVAQVKTPA